MISCSSESGVADRKRGLDFIIQVDGQDVDILTAENFVTESTGNCLQMGKFYGEFSVTLKRNFFGYSGRCKIMMRIMTDSLVTLRSCVHLNKYRG